MQIGAIWSLAMRIVTCANSAAKIRKIRLFATVLMIEMKRKIRHDIKIIAVNESDSRRMR